MKIGFQRSVSEQNIPGGNYIVMMLATVTFAIQILGDPKQQYLNCYVLKHLTLSSIFVYMWLHMNMAHIAGNLITLWIFGRRVSLKISDGSFVLSFILLGVGAAVVHSYYDGRPTIGASGAIMGVLGMHVVLCYRQFGVLGPWLILVWFVLNLTAGIIGNYPITFMAHAGGFITGMFLATLLVMLKIAKCDDTGLSLLRIIRPSLFRENIRETGNISKETEFIAEKRTNRNNRVVCIVDAVNSGEKERCDENPIMR